MGVVGGTVAHAVLGGQERVRAARVVAEHAADGVVVVCGRVRPERQHVLLLGRVPQSIQHTTRLHDAQPSLRVDVQNVVQVLGEVHQHRHVAALAAQAGATAAREDGITELASQRHRLDHVFLVARDDHADGRLPIVGAVGGVQRPAAGAEANFPLNVTAQFRLQFPHRMGGDGRPTVIAAKTLEPGGFSLLSQHSKANHISPRRAKF